MENVAVISLGCDKNRVDTERMLYRISNGGYGISDLDDADVIIVNTCAFIESARQESIDTILSCAELKKTGKLKKLIVTGCMPQKYKDELIKELPEVDAFFGAFEYDGILDAIKGVKDDECACSSDAYEKFCADENVGRLLTTYPHTAYLKIADGCDNKCTYCTIPSIRGHYRSRRIADIVAEAEGLLKDGVKELILVAQDVTRFGLDRGSSELVPLLKELEKVYRRYVQNAQGFGIRLLYCYPEAITDELIEMLVKKDGVFCPYIDIPVQHCSDKILKLMNRRTNKDHIEKLIDKLHSRGITVRTTLMTGFPSEGEAEFNELLDFVKRVKPDYAGVFAYSKEDGTPAARLPDQVKKADKVKRVNALGKAIAEVIKANNEKKVGTVCTVLYEDVDYDKNLFVGRYAGQAPDVDGRVYFRSDVPVDVGGYYRVMIDGCDDYDLYGHVLTEEADKSGL